MTDAISVGCLAHDEGDDVAVAVRDVEPGRSLSPGWTQGGEGRSVPVSRYRSATK